MPTASVLDNFRLKPQSGRSIISQSGSSVKQLGSLRFELTPTLPPAQANVKAVCMRKRQGFQPGKRSVSMWPAEMSHHHTPINRKIGARSPMATDFQCLLSLCVILLLTSAGLGQAGKSEAQKPTSEIPGSELQKKIEAGENAYRAGRYAEAEKVLIGAAREAEEQGKENSPELARSLRGLGLVYSLTGKPEEAEPAARRCLAVQMATLAPDDPGIADSLNLLSIISKEKRLGPEDPDVATSFGNLAALYLSQGKAAEAEPLLKRSLEIREKAFGPEHDSVALSLNNLAMYYFTQGRQAEAEPFLKRALEVREKLLGPESSDVAQSLNNLAEVYENQKKYAEAELMLSRALSIYEKALGPEHPDVGQSLNNLAELYRAEGKYGQAEPLYRRALDIIQNALGPEHPSINAILRSLALLYEAEGKDPDTELLWATSSPKIPRLLALAPGKVVADIGAGGGDLSLDLARRIGPKGRVFSTDIDTGQLAIIKEMVAKSGLKNVTTVLGREDDTGLPADCCDAVVLRLVYHHLTDPVAMGTSLHRALRPGGRLMIIDFRPGNPRISGDVPRIREGHGVKPEVVIAELSAVGFELIDQEEYWDHQSDRYCLVFRRKPGT